MRSTKLLALMAAAGGFACTGMNTPLYFNGSMDLVVTDPGARVTDVLALQFRNPTAKERQDLDAAEQALGYGAPVPWVSRDKVHIELSYTVTNHEDQPGTFTVYVDGANEFTKYDEAIAGAALAQGSDTPTLLPLMTSRPQPIGVGETKQGLLREDDFDEAALDLDALGRWMAPFASVLINRSEVNPIGMEMVPENLVVPAMIEIDVTFTASGNMTCRYLVRVRDDDDRLLHNSGDTLFNPQPTVFQPALPP